MAEATTKPRDPTFRNYSDAQAAHYAKGRDSYSPVLIDFIVEHHRATGGKTGVLLDVGCGPGNATRCLSPYFDAVIGADPGDAMVKAAAEIGGTSATGAPILWRKSTAEELDKIEGLEHGSVDMISSALAAHWFDMPGFWTSAAKIMRPGGTVALWTLVRAQREPANATVAKVQQIMDHFRNVVLDPYRVTGNRLAESGYEGLPLPWDSPATAQFFERETFLRKRFDSSTGFTYGQKFHDLPGSPFDTIEMALSVGSPVTRWREAHPELVGTDKDCVKAVVNQIREVVKDEEEMREIIKSALGIDAVLLCIKRAK